MNVWQVSTICFFLTTVIWFGEAHKEKDEKFRFKGKYEVLDTKYKEQSEKLLNHVLINLELNNITDKFQSSKREKLKNKQLLILMQKVN